MDKWWQDPRLDDEGTYDYLLEEIPPNTSHWSWFYQKCDDCGKYHMLNFCMSQWFRTLDGGDSFDYTTCLKCMISNKIHSIIWRVKKLVRAVMEGVKWSKDSKNNKWKVFKFVYDLNMR